MLVIFVSFCGLRRVATTSLVISIICIRLCVALIIYWKLGSIFAIMWILVYLGGMMVCLVYIIFISSSNSPAWVKINVKSHGIGIFFFVAGCKILIINSRYLQGLHFSVYGSCQILSNETYGQIISQSPLFFVLSAFILVYVLLQVLSILNLKIKFRSYPLL